MFVHACVSGVSSLCTFMCTGVLDLFVCLCTSVTVWLGNQPEKTEDHLTKYLTKHPTVYPSSHLTEN